MTFEIDSPDLIADIRRRLEQGHVAATVERIRKIAAGSDDAGMLRELVAALADTLESPPKRARGRPAQSAPWTRTEVRGGEAVTIYDLDAAIPKTDREMRAWAGRLLLHLKVRDEVDRVRAQRTRLGIAGAIREAARTFHITEPEARKAYYRDRSR